MRAHNEEHADALPVLDIASLRHVAYVLDALIYYMRSGTDADTVKDAISVHSWQDHDENDNEVRRVAPPVGNMAEKTRHDVTSIKTRWSEQLNMTIQSRKQDKTWVSAFCCCGFRSRRTTP